MRTEEGDESDEGKTEKTTRNEIRKRKKKTFPFVREIKMNDYGLIFDDIKYCVSQKQKLFFFFSFWEIILILVSINSVPFNGLGNNNTRSFMKKKVSSERSAMCTEHTIDCCCYLVENGKVIGKFSFTFFLFMALIKYVGGFAELF